MRLILLWFLLGTLPLFAAEREQPVQVFILAGQSNMEGKGAVNTLPHLGDDPEYGHLLAEIKNADGSWRVRDDVFVDNLGHDGPLTVGFGSRGDSHGEKIGPELGIGNVLGDAIDAPVLLIKTAWGGKDVANNFQSPSKGGPGDAYSMMLENVDRVLSDIGAVVPDYKGQGFEIRGFIWFQGWNDMINNEKTAAYADNLTAFIDDIREHWKVEKLPVVIGELGSGGHKTSRGIELFRAAQRQIAAVDRFSGNVRVVDTAGYWDWHADRLFRLNAWKSEDPVEKQRFYNVACDRPYHYLGSGKIFYLMGWAMGHGMTSLLGLAELPERKVTGKGAYQFAHRSVYVPPAVQENISGAHGGFAVDRISEGGDGSTWFCLKGVGLIRIDSEMTQMEVIGGDPAIVNANMHNTTILRAEKKRLLILPSDEAQKVFVCSDSGEIIRVFDNPYATDKGATEAFRVCDVEIVDGFLYATNGYANNVVFVADPLHGVDGNPEKGAWSPFTFGGSGTAHGKFGTAHGITRIPGTNAFTVADRANARLETYLVGGQYLGGINFEPGTMPCDVDYVDRVAVVGCLKGAGGKTPAPIHILEEGNLVSTLRLQEDLGLEGWTHVHNAAVRRIAPKGKLGMPRLMIIASGWNPGRIAILEQIINVK
ncbi:MAG: hypothetical protein GWP41_05930 [Planctomycetia bacterium]|nr:hypothetical protein [Planctomycetia bacterium]